MSNQLDEITKLKLAKLAQLELEIAEKEKLPHLHMHKWYKWSKEFFNDWTEKKQVVCAGNQISKSSSMIKKLIHFAVNPEIWEPAFPELMAAGQKPTQIWYLYPTKDVASVEFNEKWKMFLPQVSEDDPRYGWRAKKGSYATVHSIHFNTGVTIYFKAYKQDVMSLQTGTAAVVACFVAGTMVETKRGSIPIEQVLDTDMVLTRAGWSEVEKTFTREAEVITVPLISSEWPSITGTKDHKVWTENRGWVDLSCLKQDDLLLQTGICQGFQKKLLYLIRKSLLDTLSTRMPACETILNRQTAIDHFMLLSGNLPMDLSLKVLSYITSILIRLIIVPLIFSALLVQTTQQYIKLLSGGLIQIWSSASARLAGLFLKQDLVNVRQENFVLKNAALWSKDGAKNVVKVLTLGKTSQRGSVLPNVLTHNIRFPSEILCVKNVGIFLKATAQSQFIALRSAALKLQKKYTSTYVNIVHLGLTLLEKKLGFAHIAAPATQEKSQKEKVYCLKSKHLPEFFANGILVHNCDEELPIALLPELQMRVNATNGFMFFVFTATMGQKFWRDVVENKTQWPDARIWQVGMPDCMFYEDGTPSMWTKDRINAAIKGCVSENEVQRRIYGRFVLDSGLMFPQFDLDKHVRPYHPVPKDWQVFAGVDYGTGGKAHPAAIVVIAVNPAYNQVRMIRFWRGDKIETTAQDIVDKYCEITTGLEVVTAYYDYGPGGRDMGTIANRLGLPFAPADKGVESGRGVVQSLLKSDALILYESDEPGMQECLQTRRLVEEFMTATIRVDKRTMKNDDGLDALRYALSKIGFDWDSMTFSEQESKKKEKKVHVYTVDEFRRGLVPEDDRDGEFEIEEEFAFWQSHLEM